MEKIDGMVSDILFKNEENGYTVANLVNSDNDVVIVGCMPTLSVGESIEVEGKWTNHKIYGVQFEVKNFYPITPSSLEGIYIYLSSGRISGIKETTAKKIIAQFGVETLNIIQNNPERLSEVKGIGKKTLNKIIKSYEEDRELRNIIIQLSPYGISPIDCIKIHKKYNNNSINIINKNPYKLCEDISGIGFKKSDEIATNIGIDKNSKYRISEGIIYTLNQSKNNGHVYLPLNILIDNSYELLDVDKNLIKDSIITLQQDKKIYIDKNNCVYSYSCYKFENGIVDKIYKLLDYEIKDLGIDIEKEIENIEKKENIKLADKQKLAVKEALNSNFFILTGGPGTGKTTTIKTIIDLFENNKKKVVLASPTGRAAKRMSETSGKEAKTIHRLLEVKYSKERDALEFMKNEEYPIKADVIIIDESSMIDIYIMYSLLNAIKPGTRIIFVGDSDQLPSVGAGNVLKDMIESNVINVVILDEIFRQASESMIVVNAHRINKGQPLYLNAKGKDFFFLKRDTNEEILREIISLVETRLPNFFNLDNKRDIQILSCMRKSEVGVNNLNVELQKCINKPHQNKVEETFMKRTFRVGDKVMQIKNNYTKEWISEDGNEQGEGIYNGDIGYIFHIDKENKKIYVIFDEVKLVEYKYEELDELEHSFCTTIHKSQGSEFPVVIIPITWAPPMLLTRNLLYTAITRAKKLVILVGDIKYLEFMINNNHTTKRYSNLSFKLKNRNLNYGD